MTEKRFNVFDVDGTIFLEDHKEGSYHIGEIGNVDVNCLNDIAYRLNELHEERDYFERKKCEYQKKISILTTDKITLKSVLEDTETLMELVKEQNKLIDLKMKPETVQLLTRLENKIDYYKKVHER